MQIKKTIIFLIILLVFQGKAQELSPSLLSTSGDFFTNGSYSISWSLGEIAIETFTQLENILTQGFQQTRLTTTGIQEKPLQKNQIQLYPNPASDKLYISFNSDEVLSYHLEIFDLIGSKKISEKIETNSKITEIRLNDLEPGTYMLVIKPDGKNSTTTFIFQKVD